MAEILCSVNNDTSDDGTIIAALGDRDIFATWAEMLARGTHGYPSIPFDSVTYDRFCVLTSNRKYPLASLPDSEFYPFIEFVQKRFFKYLPYHEMNLGVKISRMWPFGREELKWFTCYIPDKEFGSEEEIKKLTQPQVEELFVDEDGIKHGKLIKKHTKKLDFKYLAKELKLDLTLYDIENNKVPSKAKKWYQKNIPPKKVKSSTKLVEIIQDPELIHPNRIWAKGSKQMIEEL